MGNAKIVVEHDILWETDVTFQRPRGPTSMGVPLFDKLSQYTSTNLVES